MVTTLINELLAADAADAISLIQRLIVDPVPRPAFKAPSPREGPYSLFYARSLHFHIRLCLGIIYRSRRSICFSAFGVQHSGGVSSSGVRKREKKGEDLRPGHCVRGCHRVTAADLRFGMNGRPQNPKNCFFGAPPYQGP